VQLTPGTLEQASRVESVSAERSRTFEFIAQMWHPSLRTVLLVLALLAALAVGGYVLWESTGRFGGMLDSGGESGAMDRTERQGVLACVPGEGENPDKEWEEQCES